MPTETVRVRVNQTTPKVVHSVSYGDKDSSRLAQEAYALANAAYASSNTKVSKSGDTISGNLVILGSMTVGDTVITTTEATVPTAVETVVDTLPASLYRSAKYELQITHDTDYEVIELSLIHNTANVWFTQYGQLFTNTTLGTFSTAIVSGNVAIQFTPVYSNTTIHIVRHSIVI